MTLINIIPCVHLFLPQPYAISCYGHAMSKCYQYATNDLKVCGGMKEVSIKEVQSSLQKTIIWTKKMGRADTNGLKLVEMHLVAPKN
jgi:hypothetical protein